MEMEYAIIEASGRQFWVEPKKFIEFNRLILKVGSTILIRRILFAKNKTATHIGQPYLQNILVKGKISKHFLGPKVLVFKMKPKKKYRKKIGHRQKMTRLLISMLNCSFGITFLSSSVVEQSAVNRLVVGSKPTWGA